MKFIKFDVSGLARSLLGFSTPKAGGDTALIKIVVQVIRSAK